MSKTVIVKLIYHRHKPIDLVVPSASEVAHTACASSAAVNFVMHCVFVRLILSSES
jgi:hypothetical protein